MKPEDQSKLKRLKEILFGASKSSPEPEIAKKGPRGVINGSKSLSMHDKARIRDYDAKIALENTKLNRLRDQAKNKASLEPGARDRIQREIDRQTAILGSLRLGVSRILAGPGRTKETPQYAQSKKAKPLAQGGSVLPPSEGFDFDKAKENFENSVKHLPKSGKIRH